MDEYEIEVNGIRFTLLLDPEDAERYGDAAKKLTTSTKQAKAPANKSNQG